MAETLFRCFNAEPLTGITDGASEKIKRGICLLRVGDFVTSKGTPVTITKKMLREMDANFDYLRDNDLLPKVPMRLIHLDKGHDARHMKNIAGYVDDVYLSDNEERLFVDGDFTQPDALAMFNNGTLYCRSAEFGSWSTADKQVFENVLAGFTWCDYGAIDQLGPPIAASAEDVDIVTLTAVPEDITTLAKWSTAYINNLSDGAFAIINAGGRHLPHHDKSGAVDMAHVSNALSRLDQTEASADEKAKARKHLEAHQPKKSATFEAPTPKEAFVMKTFTLDQIAHAELKTGEKVNDMQLLELPESEVFTLEVDGAQLICADEATHDFVTEMVTERNEAKEAAAKAEAEQRKSYVESLKTAGKILGSPEALEEELEQVSTFSSDQYERYIKRMDAQPPLVGLNKHDGDGSGDEPDDKDERTTLTKTLEDLKAAGASQSQIDGVQAKIDKLEGNTK